MNTDLNRSLRVALSLTLGLALGAAVVYGQGPRPAGGGLAFDFIATTADGKPVTDLTPADLQLKIGGKPRTVTALTLKTIQPAAAAEPAANAPAAGVTPPFVVNDAKPKTEGRSFLIAVDTDSMLPGTEPAVQKAIEGMLAGLGPGDRVAFSVVPRDVAQVPLTTDLARVRTAVAALKSQRPGSVSTAEALCRTRDSLNALNGLMPQLAGYEGARAVIFIAASLSTPGNASSSTAGSCEVTKEHYDAIRTMSADARANVYLVQADAGSLGRNDGLDWFAGQTGAGSVLRVVNEGFAPKVLSEASSYWVATIAPDPSDKPGQHQQVDLKISKAGVTPKARPEFAVPRPEMAAAAAGGAGKTTAPKDMIATKADFTDLQLQATAIVQRGAADKMNVFIFAQPADPTVKLTAMRVGYFDATNKGASLDSPQVATYPVTTVLPLTPGQYRIRVAATDTSGKSGAVDVNVDTTLVQAGPLKFSGLMLGSPDDKNNLKPRLIFSNEEKLQVFFEMYGTPTAQVTAKFEVAKTDTGPAIKTYQPAGGGPANEPDKFQIFGEIPLKDFPEPGDYVVRVVAQMEGQPEGKILRTFRKVAK